MTPITLLIISAIIFVISIIAFAINFMLSMRNTMNNFVDGKSMETNVSSFSKSMVLHILFALVMSTAALSTVGSFVWFLCDKYVATNKI